MKKILSKMAICAGLIAVASAATLIMSYADTTETQAASEERERPQDDGSVSAKIASVGSSTITVYLEERQEPPADGTQPAEGETPPEKPEGETESGDGTTPPEAPAEGETAADGTDGTTPPEGGMGHGGMNASYSEETTVITVTSSTTVTEGFEQTSVSLSSLEEGDIIRLVLDDDGTTAVSIQVMDMMDPPESAAASSES